MAADSKTSATRTPAFGGRGLAKAVAALTQEIRDLYLGDSVPWVIGYSGGKDSTAALQLVWMALKELPSGQRQKTVHVISTDTLVEQPLVAAWVDASLAQLRTAAVEQQMPVIPHKLTPEVEDTFWVNLIGRGYPARVPSLPARNYAAISKEFVSTVTLVRPSA